MTHEECVVVHALILQEVLKELEWIRKSSSGPEKDDAKHRVDVLSTVLLHTTKAIKLDEGKENGNTGTNNS